MSEWNASRYNHISTCQMMLAEEELRRLKLGGSERIIDVGCGDGKVTAEIARMVPRGSVLGVDPSHNMIDFAIRHFPPEKTANLRFAIADARSLPYREEFDLAVSFNALHWVREQEAALRSLYEALKPGGRATLRFVPKGKVVLEYFIEDTRQAPRWVSYFNDFQAPFAHFTPEEYRTMAARAGFEIDHILVEQRAWDFETPEAFTEFCRATFVEWLRRLPESERPIFITDVLSRYRAGVPPEKANEFRFQQMEVALTRNR
ncbi:MAG TPA: methyltransferase domain-containing protein [Verrucomicrobiota bacterium]|nr:class I SAM-dependent methyltransferase [Verrucomicrobiales bacterium]HRI14882.1 methyltransferase domain-containing protein [Verrucomicrobiota bacterium]